MPTSRPTLALVSFSSLLIPANAQAEARDARLLATACNQFAADLHGKLAGSGPTASPASIGLALLMLVPGARGDTEKELVAVLHLPEELRGARLHAAAKDLLERIGVVQKGTHDTDGPQLRLANDLWTQTGYPIVADYTSLLRTSYGAMHHDVAFRESAAAARKTINAHIAGVTNQRIAELLTPDLVTPATRVVLTNAIWLKAAWLHAFHENATAPGPFTLADGTAIEVPTMRLVESFAYAETDDWQCVVLPFAHCNLQCELVLPRPGRSLGGAEHALLTGADTALLASEIVQVRLPRFRVAGAHQLRAPLEALGLHCAFDATRADFSGISPTKELVVDDVVHQTWIQVDEAGAEAAAATAVVMKAGSAARPREPKVFAAERPFAFVLRDRTTGLVLFLGRVDDPRQAPTAARPAR